MCVRGHARACLRSASELNSRPLPRGDERVRHLVRPAYLSEQRRTRLGDALQRLAVCADQPKALCIPLGPLEVVPGGPVQVTKNVDTGIDRVGNCAEMVAKKGGTQLVVTIGDAVLGDHDWQTELPCQVDQRDPERACIDRPSST